MATSVGVEMRQAPGTVVFFGMIGVTFFGVFLTPVFFTAIRYLTDREPVATETPLRRLPVYAGSEERRALAHGHR